MFDYPSTQQCVQRIQNYDISAKELIYSTLVIYYMFVICLGKKIRQEIYDAFDKFNKSFDKKPDNNDNNYDNNGEYLQQRYESGEKFIKLCLKFMHWVFYSTVGVYIKVYCVKLIHTSLLYLVTYLTSNIDLEEPNFIIFSYQTYGTLIYTIVSIIFDKSFYKKNIPIKILCLIKDMMTGSIIFANSENVFELVNYAYYQTIRMEFIVWTILVLIAN